MRITRYEGMGLLRDSERSGWGMIAGLLLICMLSMGYATAQAQSTVTWSGSGDGTSWGDPNNWSPTAVPGPSSDVVINASPGMSYTITVEENYTVNSLAFETSDGTVLLNATLTVETRYYQYQSTLTGSGTLNVNGLLRWQGGRMAGSGVTNAFGDLEITGDAGSNSNTKILDGRRLVLTAGQTGKHSGNLVYGQNGAVLEIQQEAVYSITSSNNNRVFFVADNVTDRPSIENAGTLLKGEGTAGEITIYWDVLNSGQIMVDQLGAQLTIGGFFQDLNGEYTVHAGSLEFDLRSTDAPEYFFNAESQIRVDSAGIFRLSGQYAPAGELSYSMLGTIDIAGMFSIQGNSTPRVTIESTANLLNLAGRLLTIGGNRGDLVIETEEPLAIGGLILDSEGRLWLNGDLGINGIYVQNNQTSLLDSDHDVVVRGVTSWEGGTMRGTGTTFVNGSIGISGGAGTSGSNKRLDGRRMVITSNSVAIATATQVTMAGNGAVIEIQEEAYFDMQSWGDFMEFEGSVATPQIINRGYFRKSDGNSDTRMFYDIINEGVMEVSNNELELLGSLHNAAGGSIMGSATLNLLNVTEFTNEGTVAPGLFTGLDNASLTILGSYIQDVGTLDIEIAGPTFESEYDRLIVNGSAQLGGTLNLSLLNGYDPPVGTTFDVLVANSPEGTFNAVTLNGNQPPVFNNKTFKATYHAEGVTVEVMDGELSLPVARNDQAGTIENQSIRIDVLGNDYDPEGESLSIVELGSPESGAVEIVDGMVSFIPANGFTGEDQFSYTVSNGSSTVQATVTVTVAPASTTIFSGDCIEQNTSRSRVLRSCVGNLNSNHISNLLNETNNQLSFNLFSGEVIQVANQVRVEQWSDTEFSWFGQFISSTSGQMVLEIDEASGRVFSSFQVEGRSYRMEFLGDNQVAIHEIDLRGLLDESEDYDGSIKPDTTGEEMSRIEGSFVNYGPFDNQDGLKTESFHTDPVVDLLIVYTSQSRDSSGSTASIRQEIRNAVNLTNLTFENSGVNARVRLAGISGATYDETGSSSDDLSNLKYNGQKQGLDVHTLRWDVKADIVGMVVGDFEACGRGYLMDNVSTNHRKSAYFVVQQGFCLGGNLSFAHEIGHVMGVEHDRFVKNGGSSSRFNYGYVNPVNNWPASGQWRTVMAYDNLCDCSDNDCTDDTPSCTRVQSWSNPNNTRNSAVMGIASGSNAADNARALNNNALTVENFVSARPAVSGFITDVELGVPLEGVVVTASDGRTVTTDSSGFYEFLVNSGESLTVTPSKNTHIMVPKSASFTNITDNKDQDFEAFTAYIIAGRVILDGVGMEGIEIRGLPDNTPVTDANGEYFFRLPFGFDGTLTPVHPGNAYNFSPERRTYNNLTDSLLFENYQASIKKYTISGTVRNPLTNTYVPDVEMTGLPSPVQTNSSGYYEITLDHGWSGTVVPLKSGYTFKPYDNEYGKLISNQSDDYLAYSGWLAQSAWPMFKANPRHTGVNITQTILNQLKWGAQLRGTATSPVLGPGNVIYTGSVGGTLYAHDLNGDILWTSAFGITGDITASPAVGTAGLLYVPKENQLIAYNTVEKVVDWRVTADGQITAPLIDNEDGTLYFGSTDSYLYAQNASGSTKWRFGTGDEIHSPAAQDDNRIIYVGSDDGYLYAVNPDGTERWRFNAGAQIRTSPTISDNGMIYFGADNGYLYALNSSGSQQWTFNTGGPVRSTPSIDSNDNIYFGSEDNLFYALNSNGQLLWSYTTGGDISSSPAISQVKVRRFTGSFDEEVVYVGSDDGYMYAFNIIQAAGSSKRLRWRYDMGSAVDASPMLENGLYVGTDDGMLMALKEESAAITQIAVLVQDNVYSEREVGIIIWMEEQGGPLGLINSVNPERDPCAGGPLIIPDCPYSGGTFGDASPYFSVLANEELVIGLVDMEADIDAIISGNTTEGLLGTFRDKLEQGDASSMIVGGLVDPAGYAENPNGLNTGLQLFRKSGLQTTSIENPETVPVYAGHFSTDSPQMRVTMEGPVQQTFNTLNFGEISSTYNLPAGRYETTLEVVDDIAGSESQQGQTQATSFIVDITGQEGEPVAILASGFSNPDANQGGPGLSLKAVSTDGDTPTELDVQREIPREILLQSNYPNPFNPATTIRYILPKAMKVSLSVHDLLGRRIAHLVDQKQEAGYHSVVFEAGNLSSGVYIYQLNAGNYQQNRKMLLLK